MIKQRIVFFILAVCSAWACHAQEIQLWSAGAAQAPMQALLPEFEKQTGLVVRVQFAPVGALMRQLAEGGQPDVLILSTDVAEQIQRQGWVVGSTTKPLGSVGVGLAVQQGMPAPDISSPEKLKAALLQAKSITYMDPQKGTSGKHFAWVLEQLGIADQVKSKTRLGDAGFVLEPVARGEVELGIQQITEILPVKGAQLIGPLPAPLQKTTTYAVSVTPKAAHNPSAARLSEFLKSPQAAAVFKSKGFSVDF